MSFTIVEQCQPRLNRSELAVPGSSPQLFEKAAELRRRRHLPRPRGRGRTRSEGRRRARTSSRRSNDSTGAPRPLSVRINGLDTHYMYRDVVDVLEQAGDRLDLIMIPKVGTAADVYAVDMLVTQVEAAKGRKKRHRLRADHRDRARHGQHPRDRHVSSKRNEFAAFRRRRLCRQHAGAHHRHRRRQPGLCRADRQGRGRQPRDVHWGDMWHYAIARMVVAARANGLRPIDGPFGDFCRRRRLPGAGAPRRRCWAAKANGRSIPSRSASPTRSSPRPPRRSTAPGASCRPWRRPKEGKGAVALDGRLIDIASIRQAEALVTTADRIAAAGG